MKNDLEEKVAKLADEMKLLKEKLDTLMYNTVALDAVSKYMLLNQNQILSDMSLLNTVLKEITDVIDERISREDSSHYEADDLEDENDQVEDEDYTDDDDEPTGALN